jgi:intracellular sulfur oxidation DsrE/DsrF family protein
MTKPAPSSPERRSFFSLFNAGVASLVALGGSRVAVAQVKTSASTRWEPARHDQDDWLDQIPGKHRMVFDNPTPDVLADGLAFANNFFRTNRTDYGLQNNDLAVVIIARHRATPFGYNDAMWEKYGTIIAARSKVEDPKTKMPPKLNLYNATGYGELIPTRGATLESLAKQGAQFALCSVSTRGYASAIADSTKGNADEIFKELTSNLVTNARMVPAGIVAVNRAQERGYSLVAG